MGVYLDNAATTITSKLSADTALDLMTEGYGNPSSTHAYGRAAKAVLESSRRTVANALDAQPGEVFFTSGGTESDNWALLSGAYYNRRAGTHIVSSKTEHDAVLKTLEYLEKSGFEVTLISPENDGSVSPEAVAAAVRPDTCLVSLMTVNNETGAVSNISQISEILRECAPGALFHTDAAQAFLKLAIDVKKAGVHMLTVSGHKLHAPKGVGALYIKSGLSLPPLLHGGGQEDARRSGTEALPLIAAFAAAVEEGQKTLFEDLEKMSALRQSASDRLSAENPGLRIIGAGAPHILCVSLPGYRSEVLMNYLESREIYVSHGSACKRGRRSHVLSAMGLDSGLIDGALRISLSRYTSPGEIDALCTAVRDARVSLIPDKRRL